MSQQTPYNIQYIPINQIEHGQILLRPIDNQIVKEMAVSIKNRGLRQPILVKPVYDGESPYRVIFGEHRLEAARLAGMNEVLCLVEEMDEDEELKVKLLENLHRNNFVDPSIEGAIYYQLMQSGKYGTINQLSDDIGKSTGYIQDMINVHLNLDESLKPLVGTKLTKGNAIALAQHKDKQDQRNLAEGILHVKKRFYLKSTEMNSHGGGVTDKVAIVSSDCHCPKCGNTHTAGRRGQVIVDD